MPVQIDEVTAEVEPTRSGEAPAPPPAASDNLPEAELRKHRDLLSRLEARASRVRAD